MPKRVSTKVLKDLTFLYGKILSIFLSLCNSKFIEKINGHYAVLTSEQGFYVLGGGL
jgi:hypothetical protein